MDTDRDFTMVLPGGRVPARFVTLEGGAPGVEVEGVRFTLITEEFPNGIRPGSDDQRRVVDELRRRFKITSDAPVMNFYVEGEEGAPS